MGAGVRAKPKCAGQVRREAMIKVLRPRPKQNAGVGGKATVGPVREEIEEIKSIKPQTIQGLAQSCVKKINGLQLNRTWRSRSIDERQPLGG